MVTYTPTKPLGTVLEFVHSLCVMLSHEFNNTSAPANLLSYDLTTIRKYLYAAGLLKMKPQQQPAEINLQLYFELRNELLYADPYLDAALTDCIKQYRYLQPKPKYKHRTEISILPKHEAYFYRLFARNCEIKETQRTEDFINLTVKYNQSTTIVALQYFAQKQLQTA